MKQLIFHAFVLLTITITSLFSQPKLEIIGGDTYNWGEVRPNQTPLRAKVQLKNTGSQLLKISEVKPTCGCTTAPLDKNELRPGEIATLDITLRVSASQTTVTKNIKIMSNDPDNSKKIYWLKANMIRDLQIIPNTYFNFNEMTVGYEKEDKVTLKNNSKDVIKLSDFEIDPPNLILNRKGTVEIKPGQEVVLVAKFTPDQPGNFRGSVKFKTTSADNKEVNLSAFGRVKESPIFNNSKK